MTEQIDRVTECLARLPLLDDRQDRVKVQAESLVLSAGFAAIKDIPAACVGGSAAVKRQLLKMVKLAVALNNHIESMHRDALAVIERLDVQHPFYLSNDLRKLVRAVAAAPIPEHPAPKGRRNKRQAAMVTAMAAAAYTDLTGKRVTISTRGNKAGGAFVEFLGEAFKALDITASAEAQARSYLMEKKRRKNGR